LDQRVQFDHRILVLRYFEHIDVGAGQGFPDRRRAPLQVGRQDMDRPQQIDFTLLALDMPQRGPGLRRQILGVKRAATHQAQDERQRPKHVLHSRHSAPTAITMADSIRRSVNRSLKNIRASKTANSTLVSRKAETEPMGALAMANMTMP